MLFVVILVYLNVAWNKPITGALLPEMTSSIRICLQTVNNVAVLRILYDGLQTSNILNSNTDFL
jgi:hypothetical protein